MNYDVYPRLKSEYEDKGAILDLNSVRSALASVLPETPASIECGGLIVQLATDNRWKTIDADMKTLRERFPLLSFSIELVSDDPGADVETWEF